MAVEFLESVGGTISYEDSHSEGPLVVLMTPAGSLRSVYRFLTPTLVSAGYRVLVQDLRGQGDSTTKWHTYSIRGNGQDLLALIRHVDAGPAFVVGNSFSGGVAVWAAVEATNIVRGIALVGAYVRKVQGNPLKRALASVKFAWPWGLGPWMNYYPEMYPDRRPDDFDAHVAETKQSMKERGRFSAFRKLTAVPKDDSEERLSRVSVPVLVVMGTADPDFPDAEAEASFQTETLHAKKVMIEGAGHHPQADSPEEFASALIEFMAEHK